MFPFILGGVALAATGYGIAKLLGDDCNCDKKSKPYFVGLENKNHKQPEDNLLEKFELAKIELYNTSYMELKTALDKIKNLDKEIPIRTLELKKTIYSFAELTDEIKQNFEKYTYILKKTKEYITTKLDTLVSIIENENNYEKYSNDDKNLVNELIYLSTLIDKVSQSNMTNDNIDISRKVKEEFSEIETILRLKRSPTMTKIAEWF